MRDPLFVVAPPRSYASVVGAMLGQHPQAYGLPEVNLGHGDTLGACWDTASSGSGLLRLLAELHEGAQGEEEVLRARKWVLHRLHWPVSKVWAHLAEAVGEDRMLVDKSPHNAADPAALARLAGLFPGARFLQLTRHPGPQGSAVIDMMRAQGEEPSISDPGRIWLETQSGIDAFARQVDPGLVLRVRGEDLMGDLPTYLPQLCEWLGLDASEEALTRMLHPEASPFARPGPPSAPTGDEPGFLAAPALDPDRLSAIREPALARGMPWAGGAAFSEPLARLAREFGYV